MIYLLFSITLCFCRAVHIMHFFFFFLFFSFLHAVNFDETQRPTSRPFGCFFFFPITFHRFPFGSCYSDHPRAWRPAPVSEFVVMIIRCKNNIGQACTFTQPAEHTKQLTRREKSAGLMAENASGVTDLHPRSCSVKKNPKKNQKDIS